MSAPHPSALAAKVLRRAIRTPEGCWRWTGATNQGGYGVVHCGPGEGNVVAHRLIVIARDGSIPDGMTVDHVCHDSYTCTEKPCPHRRCVNPAHLNVVTGAENTGRIYEYGVCHNGGHPLRPMGTSGRRYCPTCQNIRRQSGAVERDAAVRSWAQANGLKVGTRGRIPAAVRQAWSEAEERAA